MPVVAVVDGVKIMFFANERPPAHFHATIPNTGMAHEKVEPIE